MRAILNRSKLLTGDGVMQDYTEMITVTGSFLNRPRSIYQYSNMAPRLSGQTSIFGALLGIERLKSLTILTRKPRTMLEY